MFIVKYKNVFFVIAAFLVVVSIVVMAVKGFRVGVDFTGGSVLEVTYADRPDTAVVKGHLLPIRPDAQVQEIGSDGLMVRTEPMTQAEKDEVLSVLSFDGQTATEKRFNTIGPSVGKELKSKSVLAVILVSLGIVLFIAFTFRKVAKPVSSWVYGLIAIVVLIHDVVIPAGFFSLAGLQVDTLFVVGLLTILGVSIKTRLLCSTVFARISRRTRHRTARKTLP